MAYTCNASINGYPPYGKGWGFDILLILKFLLVVVNFTTEVSGPYKIIKF